MKINAFPYVKINHKKLEKYKGKLQKLLYNFQAKFIDLQKLKPCFSFLENPFETDVVTSGCPISKPLVSQAPAVEMELLELQEDLALKMAHAPLATIEFWKQISEAKHLHLKKTSIRVISVLSTTYCCESFYSVIQFVKSKHRVTLTNQDLKELLRTAIISYQPNFKQFAAQSITMYQ